jgi:hypothetical protein
MTEEVSILCDENYDERVSDYDDENFDDPLAFEG